MERNESLQAKLEPVSQGAAGLRVVSVVLVVLGALLLVGGGLTLLRLLNVDAVTEVLAKAWDLGFQGATLLAIAWLARRAAATFDAVGELIRELGEIV